MTTYVTNNENATAFAFHGSEVVVLGVSDLGGFVVDFGSFIIDGVPADELVEDATEADLIHEAGMLNNNAKLVNTEMVA